MSKRATRALPLSGLFLVLLVFGCARQTATNEADLQVAPQDEETEGEVQIRGREPIASILQGRTSGVRVSVNPDGSLNVRIRGAASFMGGSEPLYVIDGVPLPAGSGGNLAGISAYDIESIRVLKGPPETTLYGVRGANGVVLIKTKQPGG